MAETWKIFTGGQKCSMGLGENIPFVDSFVYLGTLIQRDVQLRRCRGDAEYCKGELGFWGIVPVRFQKSHAAVFPPGENLLGHGTSGSDFARRAPLKLGFTKPQPGRCWTLC